MAKKTKQKKFIDDAMEAAHKRDRKSCSGNALTPSMKEAAFELYCEDTSMRVIAEKFNTTPITIARTRDKGKWVERKAKRLKLAASRADTEYSRVKGRHIALAKGLQAKGFERLQTLKPSELTPTETRTYIVEGVKLERELMGEGAVDTAIQINVILPDELKDV